MAGRRSRLTVVFAVVVVVALGALWGGRKLYDAFESRFTAVGCEVSDPSQTYDLDTSQASVAAQMIGEVTRFRPALPAKASVLVLMAGLQESRLQNLAAGDGDRDSVGVLQQRPSQGWGGGDAAKLTDVTEATREFLAALITHAGWQQMTAADAIQVVQVSADGTAYAKHEPEATALAAALTGRKPAGLSCSFDAPTLVAPVATVAGQLRSQVQVTAPRTTSRTITVTGAGWQTAAWFVANADRLGVDSVAHAGMRWSRSGGWKKSAAGASSVVATMAAVG